LLLRRKLLEIRFVKQKIFLFFLVNNDEVFS
jgi:hypothetical protein